MVKQLVLVMLIATLAACSSGNRDYARGGKSSSNKAVGTATGPISRACMASDRKARNPRLCGCIQAVANQHLSSSEQSTAVSFYSDPHKAQQTRQSDDSGQERFWLKYKAYSAAAEASCG